MANDGNNPKDNTVNNTMSDKRAPDVDATYSKAVQHTHTQCSENRQTEKRPGAMK